MEEPVHAVQKTVFQKNDFPGQEMASKIVPVIIHFSPVIIHFLENPCKNKQSNLINTVFSHFYQLYRVRLDHNHQTALLKRKNDQGGVSTNPDRLKTLESAI